MAVARISTGRRSKASLDKVARALAHAMEPTRSGKVLLRLCEQPAKFTEDPYEFRSGFQPRIPAAALELRRHSRPARLLPDRQRAGAASMGAGAATADAR